jgi:hypothetical protein
MQYPQHKREVEEAEAQPEERWKSKSAANTDSRGRPSNADQRREAGAEGKAAAADGGWRGEDRRRQPQTRTATTAAPDGNEGRTPSRRHPGTARARRRHRGGTNGRQHSSRGRTKGQRAPQWTTERRERRRSEEDERGTKAQAAVRKQKKRGRTVERIRPQRVRRG